MSKEVMIQEIIQACKAGGAYISGEFFFTLAFRTEAELRAICVDLNINTSVSVA
ncbi:MAG: hypothetical protein IBX55_01960 [Methyloprofundus sp.]|nr:hypothetical protein [Methyloprofundus sp.]